MSSRLKKRYNESIKGKLREKFAIANVMQIPKLEKIVINMGIAEARKDKNAIQDILAEMTALSGQKPVLTKARKSIANFKLREGDNIGCRVTLRGERMFDFFDRFCNVVCPRIADFRGFASKCDGMGNYTLGLKDQQVFPEINLDMVKRTQGMHITFVTSAPSDEQCVEMLRLMGMPFKDLPVVVAGQEGAE